MVSLHISILWEVSNCCVWVRSLRVKSMSTLLFHSLRNFICSKFLLYFLARSRLYWRIFTKINISSVSFQLIYFNFLGSRRSIITSAFYFWFPLHQSNAKILNSNLVVTFLVFYTFILEPSLLNSAMQTVLNSGSYNKEGTFFHDSIIWASLEANLLMTCSIWMISVSQNTDYVPFIVLSLFTKSFMS
jgi:hypothetical protein